MLVALAVLPLALGPRVGDGATVVPHTLAERAGAADRVALVRVVSSSPRMERNDPRRIRTFTELLVEEDLRGSGPRRLELVQRGGTVGPWTLHAPGDARFAPGERAVVFLTCRVPERCTLVALEAGKLRVDGGDAWVRDLFDGAVRRRDLAGLLQELREPRSPPARGAATSTPQAAGARAATRASAPRRSTSTVAPAAPEAREGAGSRGPR